MKLPLAIYSAECGLSWKYDNAAISYEELDTCRTVLRPMPNFDIGEKGYEGVAVRLNKIYLIRCFSVPKWDFKGRDATYLVVTWFERSLIGDVDISQVLHSQSFTEPTHDPMCEFEISCGKATTGDFEDVAKMISESDVNTNLRFVRELPNGAVSRLESNQGSDRAHHGCLRRRNQRKLHRAVFRPSEPKINLQSKVVIVAIVLSVLVVCVVAYDYFTRKEWNYDRSGEIPRTTEKRDIEADKPKETNIAERAECGVKRCESAEFTKYNLSASGGN